MTKHTHIAVGEKKAADMLDLSRADFLRLVREGTLPKPKKIASDIERWRVSDLEAIVSGEAMDSDFQW